MIDPKAIVSYAQYREDLILLALLLDVKKGYYVDIGANYPTIDSVTKLFYDKGWSGINVEPIKSLHEQLQKERPRDTNLQCGIGSKAGEEALFREYKNISGHSTFVDSQKEAHDESVESVDYKVQIQTLEQIFNKYKPGHINFLKIDVEGYEYEVIKGNNWLKYRPEVICIEANHIDKPWQKILEQKNYKLFIHDGLNDYYVSKESWHRTDGFTERAIKIDYHALRQHQWQSWSADSNDILRLNKIISNQKININNLILDTQRLATAEQLSLKNRPYGSRIKRAIYGLTIDWLRYKKG